jgi:hypothetical protein
MSRCSRCRIDAAGEREVGLFHCSGAVESWVVLVLVVLVGGMEGEVGDG